mgnify:CR=1 FL=1
MLAETPGPDSLAGEPVLSTEAAQLPAAPSRFFFARAFSTHLLGVIWLIEALNYSVHVIFRPGPWNAASVASGARSSAHARRRVVSAGQFPRGAGRLPLGSFHNDNNKCCITDMLYHAGLYDRFLIPCRVA